MHALISIARWSSRRRQIVSALCWVACLGIVLAGYRLWGYRLSALTLLAFFVTAWLLGRWIGLVAGLITFPIIALLQSSMGDPRLVELFGALAGAPVWGLAVAGWLLGWQRDATESLERQLDVNRQLQGDLTVKTTNLDQFIAVTPDLFCVVDPAGCLQQLNRQWTETLGRDLEDLQGRPYLEFLHPDDAESSAKAVALLGSGQPLLGFVNRFRHLDGSYRAVEWSARQLDDQIYAVGRDITERQQIEAARRESENRYHQLMEEVPVAVIVRDAEGILFVNQTGVRIMGAHAPKDLIGRTFEDFILGESLPAARERFENLLKGQADNYPVEFTLVRLDRQVIPVEMIATRLIYGGQPAAQLVLTDIADRKRAETQLLETSRTLQAIVQAAPVGIISYDFDGYVKTWNEGAERIFGLTAAEAVGLIAPHFTREQLPEFFALRDRLLSNKSIRGIEVERWNKDGTVRTIRLSAALLDGDDNDRPGYVSVVEDFTEARQIQKALFDSEAKYRGMVEQSTEGHIIVDEAGRIIEFNRAMARITGWSAESVLGQFQWDFQASVSLPQSRTPQLFARVKSGILDALATGSGAYLNNALETTIMRPDGSVRAIEHVVFPIRTGSGWRLGSIIRDISDRKTAEASLRASEERLRTMFAAAERQARELSLLAEVHAALASEVEMKQLYRTVVEAVAANFGYTLVSLYILDADILYLQHQVGYSVTIEEIPLGQGVSGRVVRSGQPLLIEDVTTEPDFLEAADKVLSEICVPLFDRGQAAGALNVESREDVRLSEADLRLMTSVGQQVSVALTRAHLYSELREFNKQLEKRVAERTADLERASKAKDEFLATMSHELRTPLNAVLTLTESISEGIYGPVTEKQLKALDTVNRSGQHLLSLINDILNLTKIEAGKLELNSELVNVNLVCHASLQLVEQQALRKGIALSFKADPAVRLIRVDERFFKQMLTNLLDNAVKFTPDGGQAGLTVAGDAAAGLARFTVWDSGIGMTAENISRLFKPFTQIDSGLSRRYSGTGLGLVLVQRLARMHGGDVAVASAPDLGSRFTISLPWRPENRQPAEDVAGPG